MAKLEDLPTEYIVQMCPVQGDGEHKVLALTSYGRLFERSRDPRAVNYSPMNPGPNYVWKLLKGPLDA